MDNMARRRLFPYTINQGMCSLVVTEEQGIPSEYGFVFPLHFAHVTEINSALIGIIQSGAVNSFYAQYIESSVCQASDVTPGSSQMQLQNLGGAGRLSPAGRDSGGRMGAKYGIIAIVKKRSQRPVAALRDDSKVTAAVRLRRSTLSSAFHGIADAIISDIDEAHEAPSLTEKPSHRERYAPKKSRIGAANVVPRDSSFPSGIVATRNPMISDSDLETWDH